MAAIVGKHFFQDTKQLGNGGKDRGIEILSEHAVLPVPGIPHPIRLWT